VSFYLFPFYRPRSPSQTTESLLYYRLLYLIIPEVIGINEAIQEWLLELRSACAEGKIAIALEQRRGALFYQLCTHLNSVELSIAVAFAPIPGVRKYGGPSNPVIA
jgi:hypothetical protein